MVNQLEDDKLGSGIGIWNGGSGYCRDENEDEDEDEDPVEDDVDSTMTKTIAKLQRLRFLAFAVVFVVNKPHVSQIK